MGIIAADLFITLDGVYQAPGGRDEDRTDGFVFGGWQAPFRDELIGASIMSSIERTDALLLGRRTYDIFAGFWPFQAMTGPIAAKFAAIPKYVVSRTLRIRAGRTPPCCRMPHPSGPCATGSTRSTRGAAASCFGASSPKGSWIA